MGYTTISAKKAGVSSSVTYFIPEGKQYEVWKATIRNETDRVKNIKIFSYVEFSCYIASYDIAVNKAFTVVSLKMPTTELKRLAQPGESLYGIQFTNQGQIVIFGGGVPLIFRGTLLGGLGVSGGSEEQDTHLAEFGGAVLEEEIACLYPHLR